MSTPDLRALQRHLAAARERIGAGDHVAALEEIDAALALDPDAVSDEPGSSSGASSAPEFDLDLQPPLNPSVSTAVPQPSGPGVSVVHPGPSLPSGVSAQGWAEFVRRIIRRRVDRRLEVARAAIAGKRVEEASEALDEVRELDPEHADLARLRLQVEGIVPAPESGDVQLRSGPRLMAVMVFGAVILAASWMSSFGGSSSTVWEGTAPGDTSPSVAVTPKPIAESGASDGAPGQPPADASVTPSVDELVVTADPLDRVLDQRANVPTTQQHLEALAAQPPLPHAAGSRPAGPDAIERADRPVLPIGAVVPPDPPPVETVARAADATIPAVGPKSPEPSASGRRTAEARAPEPRVPEQRATEQRATEQRATEQRTPAPIAVGKTESNRSFESTLGPAADDEALVKGTLQAYRSAYDGLDVSSAQRVWPAVDRVELARAFHNLESQRLTFDVCDVRLDGPAASAVCRGSAQYVLKMGNRTTRVEPRVWSFTLRKVGDAWTIETARADRGQ